MKKSLSKFMSTILIAALIVTSVIGFSGNEKVSAADEIKVFVTVADEMGIQALKQKGVEVTDIDGDGALTVYDALYCAHEKYYDGGAEEGFSTSPSDYGPFMTKLWGIDNGGSYGYLVNNAFSYSMYDRVQDADQINAFCYIDTEGFSDVYSFFNKRVKSVHKGKTVKLKLCTLEWNSSGTADAIPLAGANIRINDKETGLVTDENGYVKIPAAASGSYYVSASYSYKTIVAPSCVAFVQPEKGETIVVKEKKYTVTKWGKVSTGKKGKVTFSKSANNGKDAPKTIEYAGVTYKVKVVD